MIEFSTDTWSGGFFELAVELAATTPAMRRAALETLWRYPGLSGPFSQREVSPELQQALDSPLPIDTQLYGLARFPDAAIPCASHGWCFDESNEAWLCLGLPMSALAVRFAVGAFPFVDGSSFSWREPVHAWLRAVAEHLHAATPFKLGLVGFEPDDSELNLATIESHGIPVKRFEGLLIPEGSRLGWYPPTEGAPLTFEEDQGA